MVETKEIPLEQIFADPNFNCRGEIDQVSVASLAKDIMANGLQFPILVQPWDKVPGKGYRVVAGHRRYASFRILAMSDPKFKEIPATIRTDLTETSALMINLSENLERSPLNIYQEAMAIHRLMEVGMSEAAIATSINRARNWVQVRIMLLTLPPAVQEEARNGVLKQTHIRDCYSLGTPELQYEFVRKIKDAVASGEKRMIRAGKTSKRDCATKRQRRAYEIEKLQDIVLEVFGHGLTTRALAWSAGYIDDAELLDTIQETADRMKRPFKRPEDNCIVK